MKRRNFLAAIAGAGAAWPLAAGAQQKTMPAIGFLSARTARESQGIVAGFQRGLNDEGYAEGRNVAIEYRWADGQLGRLPGLAAELVAMRVAVLVAVGGPHSAAAAKQATTAIPIVFTMGDDPVKLGLVTSLSRPGGNITGVTQLGGTLSAKRFQLLRELVPHAKVIAVLVNPRRPDAQPQTEGLQKAAQDVGQQIIFVSASNPAELEVAFPAAVQKGARAMVISNDPYLNGQRELIARFATRHTMPSMTHYRENAEAGALMSYGVNQAESYQQAGVYAGRILKGARPGDLPVVQPARFELVINLKTAKALGIPVPQALLISADKVIE